MNKINLAVIGSGVGYHHAIAIKNNKFCNLKYICETNKKKFYFLKKKFPNTIITNNENLIFQDKEIQGVSIASYDHFHFNQILKCIKTKKHIFAEKPICTSLEELRLIKKNLRGKKIFISSNLVLRSCLLFKKLKKFINSKQSSLYYIEADYLWGRPKKLSGWRAKSKDYSIINGAAIHMIDLVIWMIKKKPTYVTAFGNSINNLKKFKQNTFSLIILEFSGGLIVKIAANAVSVTPHEHNIEIFFKNDTIYKAFEHKYHINKKKKKIKLKYPYPDKAKRKEVINSFIKSIFYKNEKINIVSKHEVFDLMKVCFSAIKSLEKERRIKIKYE